MTNCRNCGAVLTGHICEYCGTRYPVETSGEVLYANGEPFYVCDPEPIPTYPLDTDTITICADLYKTGLFSPNKLREMAKIKRRIEDGRNGCNDRRT